MHQTLKISQIGFFIWGILSFTSSYAQDRFVPGCLIQHNHETVYGYIDSGDRGHNPDSIWFKPEINSMPVVIKPGDVAEFRLPNDVFVSAIIRTNERSSLRAPGLVELTDSNPDTVFLQTLMGGPRSLFGNRINKSQIDFYIRHSDGFERLMPAAGKVPMDDLDAGSVNYFSQLKIYLADCPTIQERLKYTDLRQKSLVQLFQYYYTKTEAYLLFRRKAEAVNTEVGVLAGVSSTYLKFSGDNPYNFLKIFINTRYSRSVNPAGGLFLNIRLPWDKRKWMIGNELLFSSYQVHGSNTYYGDNDYYLINSTEFDYAYLKLNTLVHYRYPVQKVSLFLNGGVSNGFAVVAKNIDRREFHDGGEVNIYESGALKSSKYELGFILGTGIRYKKLSLEFRYEQGKGMEQYNTIKSTTQRYFILLGHSF